MAEALKQAVTENTPHVSVNYTPQEAAAVIGISRPNLYEKIRAGEAPPSFKLGGSRFFPKVKLHQWLDEKFEAENS